MPSSLDRMIVSLYDYSLTPNNVVVKDNSFDQVCISYISVAMTKLDNQRELKEQRVYFSLCPEINSVMAREP